MLSFITKSLADCLKLQTHRTEGLSISTFGAQTSHIRKLDVTTIRLHTISGQLIPHGPNVLPTTVAPIQNLNKKPLKDLHFKGLQLAHPVTCTEQFTINLLIVEDHYWDVVEDYIIKDMVLQQWGQSWDIFFWTSRHSHNKKHTN